MWEAIDPGIYELAFSYRDFGAEVDFIEYNWQKNSATENPAVLDIGCGTGQHLIQFASRGYDCTGIDISPEVIEYARAKFSEEGLQIEIIQTDMRKFELPKRFGLAFNMLTAANLILTNDDMISHLRSVASVLDPGGIYILEMFHPREYGFNAEFPARAWEIIRDDVTLQCDLRYEQEELDPLCQCQKTSLRIVETRDGESKVYMMPRVHRVYLYLEFISLVANASGFEPVVCYGTFNSAIKLDNSRRSWRMIPVLRRTDDEGS
jgi:SAM-dependent methyltransferase